MVETIDKQIFVDTGLSLKPRCVACACVCVCVCMRVHLQRQRRCLETAVVSWHTRYEPKRRLKRSRKAIAALSRVLFQSNSSYRILCFSLLIACIINLKPSQFNSNPRKACPIHFSHIIMIFRHNVLKQFTEKLVS